MLVRALRVLAAITVAALALTLLAGCGDDDVSDDSSSTAPTEATTGETTTAQEKPETVRVPDVVGSDVPTARGMLGRAGLGITPKRAFSDQPAGRVFDQTPRGGKPASPGARVHVDVSRGPKPPGEPVGPLGTSSIGPLSLGASEDEARAQFGEPDEIQEVNLGGGGPAPQVTWTYALGDGTVDLKFSTAGDGLRQYTVSSPSLATNSGVAIGSDIAPIEQEYGDQLRPHPIGSGGTVLSEGRPGTSPALTFVVDGSTITFITGGDLFQPAGE